MNLPSDVADVVESHLGTEITSHDSVGGGCIANASRIEAGSETYFLKWSREAAAHTFVPEAAGLRALREGASAVHVPQPIAAQGPENDGPGFLLIQWIESGRKNSSFWQDFGGGLADMHRHTADRYGFETDNYIGRLPQENEWLDDWPSFFITRRLEPQVRMAKENGRWSETWQQHFDGLRDRMSELLPARPEASILHGDLWGGNFLVAEDGGAALVDPAAYYGHREADLGMTRLFGGFDGTFYDAYKEAWPLEPGYEERLDIYNLYHLINHLNHFGSGYAGGVNRILTRF